MNTSGMKVWISAFDNDNDALIPEVWAQEALIFLENTMVAGSLVYRDFENKVARQGAVVNAHRPGTFTAQRKVDGDDVTIQDAGAESVPVKLDQHWHTSFMIYDGEESKSMTELIEYYARPALSSIAQAIDQVVLGEAYNFKSNVVGKLGTTPTAATIIAMREKMTTNKVPMSGRNCLITPSVEGSFLGISDFVNANTVGDNGTALREGHIGSKYGINFFTSQNVSSIAAGSTVVTGAINNGNLTVGSTVLTVDGFTGAPARVVGSWVTIGGDMIPQRITARGLASNGDMVQITIDPGLASAIVDGAVVTVYTPGSINQAVSPAGYAAGYNKSLVMNNFTVAPKSGQLVAFGADAELYSTVGTPTTTGLVLNRSLDDGISHADNVNIGPAGEYCWGFHRDAVALVTRPLAMPRSRQVSAAVVNYNGLSIRVVITYDGTKQGHLVTMDMLAGIKTLNTALGALFLA